ncbi:MAG: right-handed parallel beta-helix repeat-containing protein [Clostridia bacterium]|nr:right-handed parallel beta-helix repeat-containing protein [Clostridia bacterium]
MDINKRIIALLFACFFCFSSLVACSGDSTVSTDTTVDNGENTDISEPDGNYIYVDAAANEDGDGSKTAPFKTISEAQNKIREMKNGDGLPEGGITVLLASGEYDARSGIIFTEEDSGTESSPITYAAADGDGVFLLGGIKLSADDFVPLSDEEKNMLNDDTAKGAVLKVDLSKYGITSEDIGKRYSNGSVSSAYKGMGTAELFINSERMTVSRYPNVESLRTGYSDGETVFDIFSAFEFEANALALKERAPKWNLSELFACGYFYYGWSNSSLPVSDFDIEQLRVTLAHNISYGIKAMKPFYFFNIFAETDMPGEYYIDRNNLILYVYPTEDFSNSSIVISTTQNNIISAGNLSYVTFKGIDLAATRANGFAISGHHITIDNCKIYDICVNGINAVGSDITIQNCEIFNIGEDAIDLRGGDADTVEESNDLIYNNYIHHWGQNRKTSKYAVKIEGCAITVSHNEMHDTPHQAVIWNGPNHVIEYNEVYNVCLETDDCGALYAGRCLDAYGSTVRYNFIHDIGSGTAKAQAIYFDDAVSGQTAYGNVIANVTGYGIQVGGGRDNVVENNLIINSGDNAVIYDTRARDGMIDGEGSWFYEHTVEMPIRLVELQAKPEWIEAFPDYKNIIPYTVDYSGDIDDPNLSCNPAKSTVKNNMLYITHDGKYSGFAISDEVGKMGTVESNNVVVDTALEQIPGYENGDYTLTDNADAFGFGFVKLPFEEMGRIIT